MHLNAPVLASKAPHGNRAIAFDVQMNRLMAAWLQPFGNPARDTFLRATRQVSVEPEQAVVPGVRSPVYSRAVLTASAC